jgi:hypothetical protein
MLVNDPIADMLTRIRNAQIAGHDTVSIPASNMKKSIAKILLSEGFVKNVEFVKEGVQGSIRVTLKYAEGARRAGRGPHFHLKGRYDRQGSAKEPGGRRSAGLRLVTGARKKEVGVRVPYRKASDHHSCGRHGGCVRR